MLEFSPKKFHLINYLFAALILVSALLLIRHIIETSFPKKQQYAAAYKVSKDDAFRKKNIMRYSTILEKNPFGSPLKLRPLSGVKEAETEHGPISDLVLTGTATGPRDVSYAFFIDKSKSSKGKQDIFTYGEDVFNYGVLTEIGTSSVKIERDSVSYTVTMPDNKPVAGEKKQRADSRKKTRLKFAKKVGDSQYILDSTKVQQSLDNPEQILTDARLLPNIIDGRQEGFKISEVVPDGLYHSLGLRNGDILLKINGLQISNPEVAIQAMSAMKSMNRVALDIIRDGANMSMTYQIR